MISDLLQRFISSQRSLSILLLELIVKRPSEPHWWVKPLYKEWNLSQKWFYSFDQVALIILNQVLKYQASGTRPHVSKLVSDASNWNHWRWYWWLSSSRSAKTSKGAIKSVREQSSRKLWNKIQKRLSNCRKTSGTPFLTVSIISRDQEKMANCWHENI